MAQRNQITLGALALQRAGKVREVARTIGVTTRTVVGWRAGKAPSVRHTAGLSQHYGILPGDWFLRAPSAAVAPEPAPAAPQPLAEQLARCRNALCREGLSRDARLDLESLKLALELAIVESARRTRTKNSFGGPSNPAPAAAN